MSDKLQFKCPVCGTQKSDTAIFGCEQCMFDFAFVEFFADENSRNHWLNIVEEYRQQLSKKDRNNIEDYISICRDSVSFFSSKKKEVVTIFGDGRQPEKKKGVSKFVSNDNNSVVLFEDGTVEAYGDNSYGQCNLDNVKNAQLIALSSTCVFVVNSNKSIQVFGSLPQKVKETVMQWKNVEDLVVSDSIIISVDTSKRIRGVDLTCEFGRTLKNIEKWINVKKICIHKERCVALLEDGRVVVTPDSENYNDIKTWENISDIVFDGTYIVGLTFNGEIKLAGKCKSILLDAGRKNVVSWKNMVSICCSNYAFGGYDKEGVLHLTGKFGGKAERLVDEWSKVINTI